jgi:LacI family transcriptional regulator
MSKKASIYDIARVLNISASTVSRALKEHPAISERTRKLVQETARDLNYQPHAAAVSLKRGKSNTIGVIVPVIHRNFFSSVIDGVEEEAYKAGYDVLICQSKELHEREKKILASLSHGKVDGVIASIASGTREYSHFSKLATFDIPLVLFDRVVPGIAEATVTIDDFAGAYRVVSHLVNQGRRRVFHYGCHQHVSVWRDRHLGYLAALKDCGITPGEEWFSVGDIRQADGEAHARELLERGDLPDAIFCTSDYVALGMLLEFKRQGVVVPDEIAVAGFANEAFGSVIKPSLTSVDQSGTEMGRQAARMLVARINGEKLENLVMEPRLIIRESTTCQR